MIIKKNDTPEDVKFRKVARIVTYSTNYYGNSYF